MGTKRIKVDHIVSEDWFAVCFVVEGKKVWVSPVHCDVVKTDEGVFVEVADFVSI